MPSSFTPRLFIALCAVHSLVCHGCAMGESGDEGADPYQGYETFSEYGFKIRVPRSYTMDCTGGLPEMDPAREVTDMDWLCTFGHDGVDGIIYVQSTAVACQIRYTTAVDFETGVALISVDGQISDLENAVYDWGDFHHVDTLAFQTNGKRFEYAHSTYTDYNRTCQPMHCMRVYQPESGALLEDGCTEERSLPVTCSRVMTDGTHESLDRAFEPCAEGDEPRYE
jgi:hypothetical protein